MDAVALPRWAQTETQAKNRPRRQSGAAPAELLMGDRIHGALLGFIAASHQSGLDLAWLRRHGLAGEDLPAAGPAERVIWVRLWRALPSLWQGSQPEICLEAEFADGFDLRRGTLEAVEEEVQVLLGNRLSPAQVQRDLQAQPAFKAFRVAFEQLSFLADAGPEAGPEAGLEAGREAGREAGPEAELFQWRLCVDSLIGDRRFPSSSLPSSPPSEPRNVHVEAALLGLWIGVVGGTRAIPLAEQLAIAPLGDEIKRCAFQAFWQWAGRSQSDRVDVS